MINNALASSTQKTYQRAIQQYTDFINSHFTGEQPFPASEKKVILFIAFCFESDFAASTVLTYISALSYYHKMNSFSDPAQSFVVKKCIQGYQKSRGQSDTRKPITTPILRKLIASLSHTTNSYFIRVLLTAMYLLAFHALLRVGEFTYSKHKQGIIQVSNVKFIYKNASVPVAFELFISGYKHSQGRTTTLLIEQDTESELCPVKALWHYFKLRSPSSGPLFSFMDNSPVSRAFFIQHLQLSLTWAGCSTKSYKSHSFRIGRATSLASQGLSDDNISRLGRWSSSAVKNYIRVPVLHS